MEMSFFLASPESSGQLAPWDTVSPSLQLDLHVLIVILVILVKLLKVKLGPLQCLLYISSKVPDLMISLMRLSRSTHV